MAPFSTGRANSEEHSPRLLIAEGEDVTRTHIHALLKKSGYNVALAEDGGEALSLLQSDHPPRLAVVGWNCPKVTGREICEEIRGLRNRRYMYVILLINWSQQKDVAEALEAGADDCVYKPVDIRELSLRLQTGSRIISERVLQDSESRFRLAFEQAAIGMSVTDTSGRFLQVNDALCRFLGYTPDELTDVNLLSLSHPENVPPAKVFLEQLRKGGFQPGEVDRRFLCKDGSVAWASVTVSRVQHGNGDPVLVTQFKNITERKAAEERLRRSEAFARAIIDNIEDLVTVLDLEGRLQYASPSHLSGIGYAPSELVNNDVLSKVHEEDRKIFASVVEELRGSEGGRLFAFRMVHKGGSVLHFEARGSLIRGLLNGADGIVIVSRAINDRIMAEHEIQAAHAETELFLESIPSILIGLDEEGRITRWNRSAEEVFGLASDVVLGRNIGDCKVRWLHKDMDGEIGRWLHAESIYRCEDLAYEREGKRRFLGFSVRRLQPLEGEGPRFVLTGADITERKLLEGQLRQAQKLEAIGQLAAGIAHEINTPTQYVGDNTTFLKDSWQSITKLLTLARRLRDQARQGSVCADTVKEFDQAAQEDDFDYLIDEIPRAIEQSLEGLQRVTKIVKGMKEFSHPGAEEKHAIDINRAIETTVTVARHEWKYVANVITEFDPDLPLVPCLAGEFNQVVLNLIINAAHAISAAVNDGMRDKGTITISTRRAGESAEIQIKDDGTGISPENQPRIFEPFFTTKPVGKGTGQGLALAHSVIVTRHQGKMWFETEEGKGTTFFVQLPLQVAEHVS